MDELISQIGKQTPVAAAILGALLYAFRWFGTQIAKPIADRHVRYLDKQEEQMEKQTETLGKLETCMTQMQKNQEVHMGICRADVVPRPI